MIGLGLAGVTDDEAGPERGVGLAGADRLDAAEEAGAVAPSAHAAEQRLRHVLQRQVEVRHAGCADHVDQPVVELRGIEVQQPDTVDTRRDVGDEWDDRAATTDVPPIRRKVLRDEDDLARAQCVHLGEDRLGRSRTLLAAERRDRAEPTRAVTALGHLDVGPGRGGRWTGQLEQVQAGAVDLTVI